MTKFKIKVLSRLEASSECASDRVKDHKHLISIGDPGQHAPHFFYKFNSAIRVEFHDVTDPRYGSVWLPPDADDVAKIIGFAQRVKEGGMLIHCEAGISRSTAAAYIVHCVSGGPGFEGDAIDLVFSDRGIARPNWLMVYYADALLEREGRMLKTLFVKEGRPHAYNDIMTLMKDFKRPLSLRERELLEEQFKGQNG